MNIKHLALAATLCGTFLPTASHASPFYVTSESFNYSGTINRYSTLSDALNDQNSVGGPYSIATASNGDRNTLNNARDGSVYLTSGTPGFVDTSVFMTSWYFTTMPANGAGWGNPNNTNTGFVQLYDTDNSTISNISGGWDDDSYTNFSFSADGDNATNAEDYARLWAPPVVGGAGSITRGTFLTYHLDMQFELPSAATLDVLIPGWYGSVARPTSVTGSFTGIFQNTGTQSDLNGFYVFDLSMSLGTWAEASAAVYPDGSTQYSPANGFAAPAVPVPATVLLLLSGLLSVGLTRRRIG